MEKMKSIDELMKEMGMDPKAKATIAFKMWQPWNRDEADHKDDPQGFVGIYGGYKIAEKTQSDGGARKNNVFDVFSFGECKPGPSSGESGWAVSSGFMLEELKKVEPGVAIFVGYEGSEKNAHGGQTRNIVWYFVNPADKQSRVSAAALPPSNAMAMAAEMRSLPANGESKIPF